MGPIIIDIESASLIVRNKKAGGTYQVQSAYIHLCNSDGSPKRYPTETTVFPPRNNAGEVVPYKVGKYTISPQSFKANDFGIELGFTSLIPLNSK